MSDITIEVPTPTPVVVEVGVGGPVGPPGPSYVPKRVSTITSSATPAVDTDTTDILNVTALAVSITGFVITGSPNEGDALRILITDNGSPRTLTFGSAFEASTVSLPTTTVASTLLMIGFFWNSVTSKWRCVAVA